MDQLTLPEPAAGLWRRAAPALERALGQTERPPAQWSIGGPEHSAMTQHYGRAAANRRRT